MKPFLLFVVIAVNLFEINCYRIVCDYSAWTHYQNNKERRESFTVHDLPDKLCTHLNYNYFNISSDFDIMFASRSDICKYINNRFKLNLLFISYFFMKIISQLSKRCQLEAFKSSFKNHVFDRWLGSRLTHI